MNNNMYNQPNGANNVPQNMVQPQVQPVYNGQPVATPSTGGASMNNLKKSLSNIDKDTAKKYIGMGSGALLLLSVFLPYISVTMFGMTTKASLWDSDATIFKILFIILALVPIATFFFQKAKSLSYLTAGYTLSFAISTMDATEGFSGLSFGFYFMFIASIALIVLCVMEDMSEIKAMITSKPAITAGGPVANTNMQAMVPPVQQPVQQPVVMPTAMPTGPVQPVVQNVEVCNFCGQPKRNPADTVCPGCGQRY